MPTPTPQQLRAYAAEARELARAQEARATSIEDLLDPVQELDDPDTWQGGYPDEVHVELHGWKAGLTRTAEACRDDARRWRALATEWETQADEAPTGEEGD